MVPLLSNGRWDPQQRVSELPDEVNQMRRGSLKAGVSDGQIRHSVSARPARQAAAEDPTPHNDRRRISSRPRNDLRISTTTLLRSRQSRSVSETNARPTRRLNSVSLWPCRKLSLLQMLSVTGVTTINTTSKSRRIRAASAHPSNEYLDSCRVLTESITHASITDVFGYRRRVRE
jgi:hypothetical protein